MQYLASNNCLFNLDGFADKASGQGYDMSPFVRRYAKYLNAKSSSYRQMAYDFCKIKKGKEDGVLRVMEIDQLLKTLPVLQSQVDALLEFDVTKAELNNGVINACFMMLFKDLIRLLACYNDGIINLLGTYRCLLVADSVSIFYSSVTVTSLCALSQSLLVTSASILRQLEKTILPFFFQLCHSVVAPPSVAETKLNTSAHLQTFPIQRYQGRFRIPKRSRRRAFTNFVI